MFFLGRVGNRACVFLGRVGSMGSMGRMGRGSCVSPRCHRRVLRTAVQLNVVRPRSGLSCLSCPSRLKLTRDPRDERDERDDSEVADKLHRRTNKCCPRLPTLPILPILPITTHPLRHRLRKNTHRTPLHSLHFSLFFRIFAWIMRAYV